LRKRLRDELDRGVAEANATIAGYLFAAAKAAYPGDHFLAETRRIGEKGAAGHPVPGSDTGSNFTGAPRPAR